eukprot:2868914-Pyramimonas_sp.AAC.1
MTAVTATRPSRRQAWSPACRDILPRPADQGLLRHVRVLTVHERRELWQLHQAAKEVRALDLGTDVLHLAGVGLVVAVGDEAILDHP